MPEDEDAEKLIFWPSQSVPFFDRPVPPLENAPDTSFPVNTATKEPLMFGQARLVKSIRLMPRLVQMSTLSRAQSKMEVNQMPFQ